MPSGSRDRIEKYRRKIEIPIPKMVADAFMRVDRTREYVSHTFRGKKGQKDKNPSLHKLESFNHGFYMGKILPLGRMEKFQELTGFGEPRERIYSEAFIEGALAYLFEHLKPTHVAQFIIGRSLSELFNGSEDLEGALTLEEQKELIYKIAKKKFGKTHKNLRVQEMEELPLHRKLFEAARAAIDPQTHRVDLDKAFGSAGDISLTEDATSLDLARFFYRACLQDEEVYEAFLKTVPKELMSDQEKEALDRSKVDTRMGYGIAEVAIRLAEIRDFRFIHGGVGRQAKYDSIIQTVIEGHQGKWKGRSAVQPLFKHLEDDDYFQTLHLDTESNPFHLEKIRSVARTRLAAWSIVTLVTIAGLVETGRLVERQEQRTRQELIDTRLAKDLNRVVMYGGYGPHTELSNPSKIDAYKEVAGTMLKDMKQRYSAYPLQEAQWQSLMPFLQDFILKNKRYLSTIYRDNNFYRLDLVDRFLMENAMFLRSKGIEPQRPYQELYKNHFAELVAFLNSDDNTVVVDRDQINQKRVDKPQLELIGTFTSGQGSDNEYHFYYLTQEDGSRHIVAKDGIESDKVFIPAGPASEYHDVKYDRYSAAKAKEGVRQFIYAMQRYEALDLMPYAQELSHLRLIPVIKGEHEGKIMCDGKKETEGYVRTIGSDVRTFRDPLGRFSYEFIVESGFDEPSFASAPCILARKEGKGDFTTETAIEMAEEHHEEINSAWHDFQAGKYFEARLHVHSLPVIQRDKGTKVCRLDEVELDLVQNGGMTGEIQEEIEHVRNYASALEEKIEKHDEKKYSSYRETLETWDRFREVWNEFQKIVLRAGIWVERADKLTK